MTRQVTIALAQHDCVLGDKDANLAKIERYLRQAADLSADLVVFPELGTTGYRQDLLGDKLHSLAESAEGPASQRIGKLAAELGLWVVLPLIEASSVAGVAYNSVVLIDRNGEVVGSYRKNHAYSTEGRYFAPGREMPVFNTDFGRLGIMICYDMGLPETARVLTLQGAELIVVPSAWCQEDEDIWDINIACRALENRCFLAAVNRVGTEGETLTMHGKSKIAGPRGQTLAEGARFAEDLVVGTVDLDDVVPARDEIPYLRSRRPWSYGPLTDLRL
ncbi:nitrilase-related carbon-nitrogen hydrolase [Propionimicrobium sp. PCR01-08-3]|uniref:nitrilase-related carbon-nitrogen hydrolase n=1 Tax=Propionimicrobium sp. PCR01-08-3 TaxID=3052086 RepID=UPI00255D0653|nr:nitrilase-related carbon-nitrogen hydrolase [Propionimicrobium sp. PCR01-08-3]WIY83210.1 nitrilase-related carbon-nitrogen hydrolase [Propionimicrobium sp. PCR01-08-3]